MEKPSGATDRPGDDFQQGTIYTRGRMGRGMDWSSRPEPYKTYPSAVKVVQLPSPEKAKGAPLWDAAARRRSVRRYSAEPLAISDVSQLLWASQGVTAEEGEFAFRTAPSAGALYPVETYLVVNNVQGLQRGVYHYGVQGHRLELLRAGEFGHPLSVAALGQEMCARAPVVFVWTAVIQRSRWKYAQRGYRYIYLDAGHIAAHVALGAVALGLGSCQIGAFYDAEVNEIVQVDGKEEFAIYMTSVGHLAG